MTSRDPVPVVGVPLNTRATAPAEAFARAAQGLGVSARVIDLATVRSSPEGVVSDQAGPVNVTHLLPGLLYGEPQACRATDVLTRQGVKTLNPLEGVGTADDKIRTARALDAHAVPQPAWRAIHVNQVGLALELGLPLVLKRPFGALGMWVARVTTAEQLDGAARHLLREGGDVLLAQSEVSESLGQAIRAIVLTGQVLAATIRTAVAGEWRSNVARGGTQFPVELSSAEVSAAVAAGAACGVGFSGVDIVRSKAGPLVLEVNASPGFTSMLPFVDVDIARAVVLETLSL